MAVVGNCSLVMAHQRPLLIEYRSYVVIHSWQNYCRFVCSVQKADMPISIGEEVGVLRNGGETLCLSFLGRVLAQSVRGIILPESVRGRVLAQSVRGRDLTESVRGRVLTENARGKYLTQR